MYGTIRKGEFRGRSGSFKLVFREFKKAFACFKKPPEVLYPLTEN